MGVCRDTGGMEIDMVKEMAEGLGNSGAALEQLIEKAVEARKQVLSLMETHGDGISNQIKSDHVEMINDSIRNYNSLVNRAQHALDWLLIQREACGFRTHRNVNSFYPIPQKIGLLKT
jgi:hypothetical protein